MSFGALSQLNQYKFKLAPLPRLLKQDDCYLLVFHQNYVELMVGPCHLSLGAIWIIVRVTTQNLDIRFHKNMDI